MHDYVRQLAGQRRCWRAFDQRSFGRQLLISPPPHSKLFYFLLPTLATSVSFCSKKWQSRCQLMLHCLPIYIFPAVCFSARQLAIKSVTWSVGLFFELLLLRLLWRAALHLVRKTAANLLAVNFQLLANCSLIESSSLSSLLISWKRFQFRGT